MLPIAYISSCFMKYSTKRLSSQLICGAINSYLRFCKFRLATYFASSNEFLGGLHSPFASLCSVKATVFKIRLIVFLCDSNARVSVLYCF